MYAAIHENSDCLSPQLLASLPKEAQKVYLVNETIATHRINDSEYSGSQKQHDDQVVETVRETAERTRKWFPW